MKTKLFNFILLGTLLMTGVVSAQGTFATPVHTGGFEQNKSGAFVASFLKAGLKLLPTGITPAFVTGFLVADKVVSSPQGFFTTVVLPINKKGDKKLEPLLRVGSSSSNLLNATFSNRAPVTVDLVGRGESDNSKGRDAIALLASSTECTPNVSIISTNTSAFSFYSDTNARKSGNLGDNADIIARQIQLKGGNPGSGKVLISIDDQGTATWATVRVNDNGEATYEYATSPVYDGLCEGGPVVIIGCMDRSATNYNPNATQNNQDDCKYATWKTGEWGACQFPSNSPHKIGNKVGFYDPVPQIGNKGETCNDFLKRISGAVQTRSVECVDKDGKVVSDTLCTAPKPDTTQPCTPKVSTTIAQYPDPNSDTFGGINIYQYNARELPKTFANTCVYVLEYTAGASIWSNAKKVDQIRGSTTPPNINDWYTKNNSYTGVAGSRTDYQMPACVLMNFNAAVPNEVTVANGRKASYYPATRCYRIDTSGPGGEWDTYFYDMYLNWIQ